MPGYNLRSRKVQTKSVSTNEDIETNNSPVSTTSASTSPLPFNDVESEIETLRENNKNLYSKYTNISRSKLRMKHVIEEKDAKIINLEKRIQDLLENKKNYSESKDLSEDWVSLE